MANIAVFGIGLQGLATAQDLVADLQPGSVLVFPKFDERGDRDTHLRITNTHDTEYVGVRLDIICPGIKGFGAESRCEATDVHLRISPHGTALIHVGRYAPCNEGFVVAIAEEAPLTPTQPSSGQVISWNYLTGSYHILSDNASQAASAIGIQSIHPDGTVLTSDGLQFGPDPDPATQDYVALGTTLYTDFLATHEVGDEKAGSELILLSLDTIVGAQNPPTLVNINFWSADQVQYSASLEYVCWTRVRLEQVSDLFRAHRLGTIAGSMKLTPAANCPLPGACPDPFTPYRPVILGAITEFGPGTHRLHTLYHDNVPNSTIYDTWLPTGTENGNGNGNGTENGIQ